MPLPFQTEYATAILRSGVAAALVANENYFAKVGSFNINPALTATQTQAITGVGFTPKIVLFWWGGSTGTGDTVAGGSINYGFGAAVSSSSRCCAFAYSLDAGASSDSYGDARLSCCIAAYIDGTPTIDGLMDFSSMDADGFTLVVDDQFASAYRVSYLALGGDDLTNVFIGPESMPVTTGNYSITNVGFQPDVIFTLSNQTLASTYFTFGMATGASNQGAISVATQDNQATTNTFGYGYNGEVVARCNAPVGVIDRRDAFVSFDAQGYTFNHLEGAGATNYLIVALKGGQYSVGDLTTKTDGTDIAETVGFQPVALLFASANRALSTQDTPTANARLSIGAATSTSNRACAAISDEDNLADSETAYANYDSAVYANVVDDAAAGLMDIKSIDATGFTCVMDDADPSGCWVTYLAIGGARVGGLSLPEPQPEPLPAPVLPPEPVPEPAPEPVPEPARRAIDWGFVYRGWAVVLGAGALAAALIRVLGG